MNSHREGINEQKKINKLQIQNEILRDRLKAISHELDSLLSTQVVDLTAKT